MDHRWWEQDAQQEEGGRRIIERYTRFRRRWRARGSLLSASSSPITPSLAPPAAASRVEGKQGRGARQGRPDACVYVCMQDGSCVRVGRWMGGFGWMDGWRRLPLSTAHIGTALLRMNE
jgi:hypothetical protein